MEQEGYRALLERMLLLVPDELDKREGSPISIALGPVAAMAAEQRAFVDMALGCAMPDTAMGGDLTRVCEQFGVRRYAPTAAVRRGRFVTEGEVPAVVPKGARFAAERNTFCVLRALETAGEYALECEQTGSAGNAAEGALLPLKSGLGLSRASLGGMITPGEDEEQDEALRARFFATVRAQPFGGNVAQYKALLLELDGVGNVRVFPTPNGEGGRVHCVLAGPGNQPLDPTRLMEIEATLDPQPKGKGMGLVPVGHFVTASTVRESAVEVTARIWLKPGCTAASVRPGAAQAVADYLRTLDFDDGTVRAARVEAAILAVPGVADVADTMLCGVRGNLVLPQGWNDFALPILGGLQLTEAV